MLLTSELRNEREKNEKKETTFADITTLSGYLVLYVINTLQCSPSLPTQNKGYAEEGGGGSDQRREMRCV